MLKEFREQAVQESGGCRDQKSLVETGRKKLSPKGCTVFGYVSGGDGRRGDILGGRKCVGKKGSERIQSGSRKSRSYSD